MSRYPSPRKAALPPRASQGHNAPAWSLRRASRRWARVGGTERPDNVICAQARRKPRTTPRAVKQTALARVLRPLIAVFIQVPAARQCKAARAMRKNSRTARYVQASTHRPSQNCGGISRLGVLTGGRVDGRSPEARSRNDRTFDTRTLANPAGPQTVGYSCSPS
jgi:hypothetical protein